MDQVALQLLRLPRALPPRDVMHYKKASDARVMTPSQPCVL